MMSLVGIAAILLIAYLCSAHRHAIKWRTVGGAFAIQLAIGAFVLYVPAGKDVLISVSDAVGSVIGYANQGNQDGNCQQSHNHHHQNVDNLVDCGS